MWPSPHRLFHTKIVGIEGRPIQAITVATLNAAELLQVADQCGTLAAGKKANFIVLEKDPSAKATYHRFGQYSRALDQIRLCLEHRAVERAELQRMCSELRIPGDFDVAQISWRPDYDPFFYRQLSRRARRIYLFRDEYIFDAEKAVVVETPQLGH